MTKSDSFNNNITVFHTIETLICSQWNIDYKSLIKLYFDSTSDLNLMKVIILLFFFIVISNAHSFNRKESQLYSLLQNDKSNTHFLGGIVMLIKNYLNIHWKLIKQINAQTFVLVEILLFFNNCSCSLFINTLII